MRLTVQGLGFKLQGWGFGVQVSLRMSTKTAYKLGYRCRANMAHIRQSRPDSGLGFQVKILTPFHVVPSSLGSGFPNGQEVSAKNYAGATPMHVASIQRPRGGGASAT